MNRVSCESTYRFVKCNVQTISLTINAINVTELLNEGDKFLATEKHFLNKNLEMK